MAIFLEQAFHTILRSKYLQRYAEIPSELFSGFPELGNVTPIVIPVFNEPLDLVSKLTSPNLEHSPQPLWIVVANVPDNAAPIDLIQTQALIDKLFMLSEVRFRSTSLTLLNVNDSLILLVNRIDQPIPHKHGVGLARKIGADIACHLMLQNKISLGWIGSTDADTHLPKDYCPILETHWRQLQLQNKPLKYSALLLPFTHTHQDITVQPHFNMQQLPCTGLPHHEAVIIATHAYEQHLHYYVAGLSFANSPYAYHALGSIIAINPIAYCLARGFPKRAAGEDFYLLNKLNKLSPVKSISSSPIIITPRLSHRVPFGTGPAVAKLITKHISQSDTFSVNMLTTYHPITFTWLKALITLFSTLAQLPPLQRIDFASDLLNREDAGWKVIAKKIGLLDRLHQFNQQYNKESQSDQFLTALHNWFDAFKTVKFAHLARDLYLGEVSLDMALSHLTPTTDHSTITLTPQEAWLFSPEPDLDRTPTHAQLTHAH